MKDYKLIAGCFSLILLLLLLGGCSEKSETNADSPKPSKKEKINETIPVAPRDLEAMIAQKPGILVKEHLDPELEVLNGWDANKYTEFLDKTFKPLVEKELQAYFEKNKDLTSDKVYDLLVYQLGSGQYKTYYDELGAFEHGHEMPELPEGEEEIEIAKKQKTNVVILIDASGSMNAEVSGGVKMELAKETIKQFTDELPEDVNVSLLAYGHVGSGSDADKAKSCKAIDVVYPLNSYNSDAFNKAIDSFQANGWTPLAGAMEKANELLSSYNKEEYKNIVYIVSDGIETCDGDPIEAAKKLNDSNIEAKVNIIGFDVDDEGQKHLKQVAEASDGKYATVRDKSELEDLVLKKWKPSIFQVFSTQGILLHETVDQMERLNQLYLPLYTASEREQNRITSAVYYLQDNDFISREIGEQVIDQAEQMHKIRHSQFEEIRNQKETEAQQARDEIDAKVKAWKDKWYKELEKE
ncbi:vWA domain-containing protein [Bacillus sp. J33]|uniref:vWA domain-containing protein n=1 Tax=Bacillus sp. J33 TaxID=935836 RepID=UPI0004BC9929|nr:VWA domain-containing protein [Bacillus sp. J33]